MALNVNYLILQSLHQNCGNFACGKSAMPKSTLRLQLQLKLKPEVLIVCMKNWCRKDESFWSGQTGEGFGFLSSSACALPNLSMLGEEEWVGLAVRSMEKERKKESRSNWEQRNRSLRMKNWKRNHPHW